ACDCLKSFVRPLVPLDDLVEQTVKGPGLVIARGTVPIGTPGGGPRSGQQERPGSNDCAGGTRRFLHRSDLGTAVYGGSRAGTVAASARFRCSSRGSTWSVAGEAIRKD